jgi:predicted kinase
MPNYDLLKILFDTKVELKKILNLTNSQIIDKSLEYFKKYKKRIIDTFIINKQNKQKLYLSCGASGAGKTEFLHSLTQFEDFNIIDTEEIRKLFPHYSGANAQLFQKASIKAVETLIDTCFKYNYTFVLDTNLASFEVANKNIQRALKRDYIIEIFFIYRDYNGCKKLTTIREQNENRNVPDEVFNQKAIGSLDTFGKLIKEYGQHNTIDLTIIDLEDDKIINKKDINLMQEKLKSYKIKLEHYLSSEQ